MTKNPGREYDSSGGKWWRARVEELEAQLERARVCLKRLQHHALTSNDMALITALLAELTLSDKEALPPPPTTEPTPEHTITVVDHVGDEHVLDLAPKHKE